jgi:negative regulator of flagellin synthesis FlgM
MKITGENPFLKLEAFVKQVRSRKGIDSSSRPEPQDVVKEDKVILSPKAKEIQEARRALDSLPDCEEERVAQIRKQIAEGSYTIQEERVADRMVEESLLTDILARAPETEE